MTNQLGLFDAGPSFPPGFKYQPGLISSDEELALVEQLKQLPFKEFLFHGYVGNRRVVSYGWQYDFSKEALRKADDMPPFLLALREPAASFAGMPAEKLQHVLVTEYSPGAGIGWHRDKRVFGEVVGISLLSSCVFRLRRQAGSKWERVSLTAERRSAYLLSGAARTEWEHSIPPVDELRYSITFRNFADDRAPEAD
jgi:alkylated DNA repair dioxygenase AlkB